MDVLNIYYPGVFLQLQVNVLKISPVDVYVGAARTAAFDRVGRLRQSLSVVPDRLPVYLQIAKLLMQARTHIPL